MQLAQLDVLPGSSWCGSAAAPGTFFLKIHK